MYSPVYSIKTGWVVGKIIDHVAHPLDEDEITKACEILNSKITCIKCVICSAENPLHKSINNELICKICFDAEKRKLAYHGFN